MCGVPVTQLEMVPEFRRAQALVVIRARRNAAAEASAKAKTLIPPDYFAGM